MNPYCLLTSSTHLRDAQPLGVGGGVVEAKREIRCLVRVKSELLVAVGGAARRDLAVENIIVVHLESSVPLRSLVESDVHPYDVLGFIEVVVNAASFVSVVNIVLARPARVGVDAVVSSVFGFAAVGATAIPRRPLVKSRGVHYHSCPFSGIDEGVSGRCWSAVCFCCCWSRCIQRWDIRGRGGWRWDKGRRRGRSWSGWSCSGGDWCGRSGPCVLRTITPDVGSMQRLGVFLVPSIPLNVQVCLTKISMPVSLY